MTAREAVNAGRVEVEWETVAGPAMETSGVDCSGESRVEQAAEENDGEGHSKGGVAELAQEPALLACVEREVVRRVDERLSRMRIVSTIVIDD